MPRDFVLAIEALKMAKQDLAVVDFSVEAWYRSDNHAMPKTIGRVTAHVDRALHLLSQI